MRARLVLAAGLLLVAGCNLVLDPDSVKLKTPHFSGEVGTTWEPLSNSPLFVPGFSDYTPAGKTGLYAFEQTSSYRFDPAGATSGLWSSLKVPPVNLGAWPGSAWMGDALILIQANAVYQYSITSDQWTSLVTGVTTTTNSQVTHDDAGRVYAVESVPPYRVVRYDTVGGTVSYLATGSFNNYVYEPRIAWDPVTARLYIGVAYDSPELWAFDPAHPGTAVRRADVPFDSGIGAPGMGDPFCGDRSGHLFAIGDNACSGSGSKTVYQYDTKANTWRRIPDYPVDHGCDGACTVSDDGWLYLVPADTPDFFRLRLH